jgi:hypothetical protein
MANKYNGLGLVTGEPIAPKAYPTTRRNTDHNFGFFAALLVLINLAVFVFFCF